MSADEAHGTTTASASSVTQSQTGWQGPSLRFVFGTLILLALVLGFGAYRTYSRSFSIIGQAMAHFDEAGKTLSADACIDEAVHWYMQECDANVVMCEEAVSMAMGHCLGAQDRRDECELLDRTGVLNPEQGDALAESREHGVGSGQWVFYTCKARGTMCEKRKKCPCAEAVRSVDAYCKAAADAEREHQAVQS